MSKNIGKIFEDDFKKSVPNHVLIYRLPDSAQSFGKSEKLRFSSKSPFDFLMWDSKKYKLYALELKTVAGESISFERSKSDTGVIHIHQIKSLNNWNKFDGIICGFIIEFRDLSKTIFINIDDFNLLCQQTEKKSFNYGDLSKYNINYVLIDRKLKRTHYKYDIKSFLETMK